MFKCDPWAAGVCLIPESCISQSTCAGDVTSSHAACLYCLTPVALRRPLLLMFVATARFCRSSNAPAVLTCRRRRSLSMRCSISRKSARAISSSISVSGDGRIVLTAAQRYRARGFGVDIDPELVEQSNAEAQRRGLAGRVTFQAAGCDAGAGSKRPRWSRSICCPA